MENNTLDQHPNNKEAGDNRKENRASRDRRNRDMRRGDRNRRHIENETIETETRGGNAGGDKKRDKEISNRVDKLLEVETITVADPEYDESEDVATAEDMVAYAKESAEKRARKQKLPESETALESSPVTEAVVDPYEEADPQIPWEPYQENVYVSRGCNHCPQPYVPVEEQEMRSCCKVGACDWMKDIRRPCERRFFDCVEVRFKNNRKDYYRLPEGIEVKEGDLVAVEGAPGHDIGIVSLRGEACRIQMEKKHVNYHDESVKKLYRRARAIDIDRWVEAIHQEHDTLLRTREIAEELGLVMKVNDVEYQGDNNKAIFYYTADERVDFRELIKVLAEEFHVRIEMKQIGVRQEAGKVGGIGTCGRELCCCTWLTNFKSVTTSVARDQQIIPNPQKLAGQCGKLKCCLNFEHEVYLDALKKFPPANTPIRFKKGLALYKKTDVLRGIMWYAYEGENDLYAISADDVKQIIAMNAKMEYPEKLEDYQVELMSATALAQESSTDEFERELKLMADTADDHGVKEDTPMDNKSNRGNRDNQSNRNGRNNRQGGNRPNGNRSNRDENQNRPQGRDGEKRSQRSNANNRPTNSFNRSERTDRNNRQRGNERRNSSRDSNRG